MENKKNLKELIKEKNKLKEELVLINKKMRKLKKEIEDIVNEETK